MAKTTLNGNPVTLDGIFPEKNQTIDNVQAVKADLSPLNLNDFEGKRKILNIFPSVDTPVCANSVRAFNKSASELDNTAVICLSFDLPFAHGRFCGAEGIENVVSASLFRDQDTAKTLGVKILDGPLAGLAARAVIVLDESNKVVYSQLVDDIKNEPDYADALAVF